jgi:hypothetical protein
MYKKYKTYFAAFASFAFILLWCADAHAEVVRRPEKINYAKMEKIARLIHQASWEIANADARPKPSTSRTVSEKH